MGVIQVVKLRPLYSVLALGLLVGCGEVKTVRTLEPADDTKNASATPRPTVSPGVRWVSNYEIAVKEAKKSGKIMMVDFYTDWCTFCQKMDIEAFIDKEVVELSAQMVPVKVNAEREMAVSKRFGVDRFPMILFIDKNQTVVGRIDGYKKPEDVVLEMKAVL